MEITTSAIDHYCALHTTLVHDLLHRIERETYLEVLQPHMLSGTVQGQLLSMLCSLINAEFVLEFGTYTGYATLCMAQALANNGKLITLEKNDEIAERAQQYFNQSNYASQIDLRVGNAIDILPTLTHTFDFVFIDADKKNNKLYYDWSVTHCRKGALIIIDNVLWKGRVTNTTPDKDTQAIMEFNTYVNNDNRTEKIMLPLRDGLYLTRKL
ncbi:MAG: class I SAM-dependent methyltransferase [Bacteroidia bacterium]|nr:class I SAM-dependent methyltransferase [Bacteroidia bacterium]